MRSIATAIIALALIAFAPSAATAAPIKKLSPCVFEDGSGGPLPCFWNAAKQGNGVGRSFWVDTRGRVHYVPTKVRRSR